MEAINRIDSTIVPVLNDNIDTDQIIPARFLKQTSRDGFGENLFRDWRFDDLGNQRDDFSLNQDRYKGRVLLAGDNFGCGSSREHAAWALYDYGFRAVISTSFADIFKNNALNNGLLPIEISEELHQKLKQSVLADPNTTVEINLEEQVVTCIEITEKFEINSFKKSCLIKGQDEFGFLVELRNEIESFEDER
ncbi:MAG: 3-isopropylmalate dehydratase small subunit [Bacteroidota bacterium]